MKFGIKAFASALVLFLGNVASADYVSYVVPTGTTGNQAGFSIGSDFTVSSPIIVTSLGAFNTTGNPFQTTIHVRLYDISNISSPVVLASADFTTANSGTSLPGFANLPVRFLPSTGGLVTLTSGKTYSIVADGFSGVDQYLNNSLNAITITINNPVVGTGSRYGSLGGFPSNPVATPTFFYAATFAFVPEPSSVVLMGLGVVGVVGYGLRKKQYIA